MSQILDYTNVSLALSEVLAEIGLNDVIVKKRRRASLEKEAIGNVILSMMGRSDRSYFFGSQGEGTTTRELNSDIDIVVCKGDTVVVPEWGDWRHGVRNLLMMGAEATPSGYCMLQVLRPDAPLPQTEIVGEDCFRDRQGRIFLKNTVCMDGITEVQERHGPAFTTQGRNGVLASDMVLAYKCTSQLSVVQLWLSQLNTPWPSEDTKRCIANSPCFVVPVGCKGSANEILEWRISSSLAERCLMFSLNKTQLQVYVLMKMLLKTSINYNVPEESHISSFLCKTVLLHCVQNTDHNAWQSHMLIQCLQFSLVILYVSVVKENCPHFVIRSNNLMAGRFTQQAKYQLQENLRWLFDDIIYHGILSLHIDKVAVRLMQKLNPVMVGIRRGANDKECQIICYCLALEGAAYTQTTLSMILKTVTEDRLTGPITRLQQYAQHLEHVYRDGNTFDRSACRLFTPYFYTALGSLLASENIQSLGIISPQSFLFFYLGLNSDIAFCRLKLASVFFCVGDMGRAEMVLRDLEAKYDVNVCTPICGCIEGTYIQWVPTRVEALSLTSHECDISKMTSACVFFTQAERNCIPQELHYEMYRSTREDLQYRRIWERWMDWAVVDSLPYLHFLCYKVYGRLQKRADQQMALFHLMVAIQTEPYLSHKETALNLLGQCMEQENKWNYALQCYIWSLNIRPKNNAAKFHVFRLLFMKFRQCHT